MEKWVGLETKVGSSISLSSGCVAAAGANGCIRLFNTRDLKYEGSLPLPPSLQTVFSGKSEKKKDISTVVEANSADVVCLRFLPSATKLAVIYSDNSLFIWDVSNKTNIGKYRR